MKVAAWKAVKMIEFDRISIEYHWRDVQTEEGKPYRYPASISEYMKRTYAKPAVYRWAFFRNSDAPYAANIGEAENLAEQRAPNYLKAHPSQKTNYRMKGEFEAAISEGAEIRLQIQEFKPFALNNVVVIESALYNQHVRKMLENMVIADADNINCELRNRTLNPIERRRLNAAVARVGRNWSEILEEDNSKQVPAPKRRNLGSPGRKPWVG